MHTHDLRPWQHEHVFDVANPTAERSTWLVMWITAAMTVVEIVAYGAAMLATNRLNTTLGIPIDDDLVATADAVASEAEFARLLGRDPKAKS